MRMEWLRLMKRETLLGFQKVESVVQYLLAWDGHLQSKYTAKIPWAWPKKWSGLQSLQQAAAVVGATT